MLKRGTWLPVEISRGKYEDLVVATAFVPSQTGVMGVDPKLESSEEMKTREARGKDSDTGGAEIEVAEEESSTATVKVGVDAGTRAPNDR